MKPFTLNLDSLQWTDHPLLQRLQLFPSSTGEQGQCLCVSARVHPLSLFVQVSMKVCLQKRYFAIVNDVRSLCSYEWGLKRLPFLKMYVTWSYSNPAQSEFKAVVESFGVQEWLWALLKGDSKIFFPQNSGKLFECFSHWSNGVGLNALTYLFIFFSRLNLLMQKYVRRWTVIASFSWRTQ